MNIAVPIIIVAMVAVLGFIAFLSREHRRATALQVQAAMESIGLQYQPKGDADFLRAWSILPGIPKRGDIQHIGFGVYRALPVTVFRHRYVVSTGQSTAVILHWVFTTDTPQWPAIHLRKRSGLGRLLGHASHATKHEEFDRAWVVKAESTEFAAGLLTEPVRTLLLRPRPEFARRTEPQWHFIAGKLCLVIRGDVKAGALRLALDHLIAMWEALSPA